MFEGALIETVVAVLRELGGYFVWRAEHGEEYIVMSRKDFDQRTTGVRDTQLGLLGRGTAESGASKWTADDMLDKINRDLALYQLQREEELEEENGEVEEDVSIKPLPPIADKPFDVAQGKHVRFEPLRGDLPPDLQD
jgi:hypothetical protein